MGNTFIDWSRFLDRIYCVTYNEYRDRQQPLSAELSRVGILDSGLFELRVTYKDRLNDIILDRMGADRRSLILTLFLETSRILCEARAKGYSRIMILEDDARFLLDKAKILRLLEQIPPDANCVQLSKHSGGCDHIVRNWKRASLRPANDAYVRGDGCEVWSAACYILQNDGIKMLHEEMLKKQINTDALLCNIGHMYIAKEDMVVQQPFSQSERSRITDGGDLIYQGEKGLGVRMEDYNLDRIDPPPRASVAGLSLLSNAFAVCFTGKPSRATRLLAELSRVGVPSPHVIWTFPNPFRALILKNVPHIKDLDSHPGAWGATLGNYRAVKTAYGLGKETALIMEDDCRFLNDLSRIEEALDNAPPDWDILMLDHFGRKGDALGNAFWRRCDSSWSTACYIVNRRAMERLIDMYESPVSGRYKNPMMRNCDHWTNVAYLGNDMRIYCAVPNLAIQCDCGDTTNYNAQLGNGVQMRLYSKDNVNLSNYAPF